MNWAKGISANLGLGENKVPTLLQLIWSRMKELTFVSLRIKSNNPVRSYICNKLSFLTIRLGIRSISASSEISSGRLYKAVNCRAFISDHASGKVVSIVLIRKNLRYVILIVCISFEV